MEGLRSWRENGGWLLTLSDGALEDAVFPAPWSTVAASVPPFERDLADGMARDEHLVGLVDGFGADGR